MPRALHDGPHQQVFYLLHYIFTTTPPSVSVFHLSISFTFFIYVSRALPHLTTGLMTLYLLLLFFFS